jgi:hypothetical protein
MKQFFLVLVVLIAMSNVSFAQKSLSDYSFVVVPERFDFLFEDNQYQLNAMAKFFFEKNGFNAFYFKELPNVDNCDGLWADIETISGFTRTKMIVILKDCKGKEVYSSDEGSSKYKEYRKSYQEALRSAFKSFETLNVHQADVLVKEIATENAKDIVPVVFFSPENKFNSYLYNGISYLLKKIESGYNLYEESETTASGLILKGSILKTSAGYSGILFESQYHCSFSINKDMLLVKADGSSMTLLFQN